MFISQACNQFTTQTLLNKKDDKGEGGQKLPSLRQHILWTTPFSSFASFAPSDTLSDECTMSLSISHCSALAHMPTEGFRELHIHERHFNKKNLTFINIIYHTKFQFAKMSGSLGSLPLKSPFLVHKSQRNSKDYIFLRVLKIFANWNFVW